jgi:tetratricopeptide (TPR) repeat protein
MDILGEIEHLYFVDGEGFISKIYDQIHKILDSEFATEEEKFEVSCIELRLTWLVSRDQYFNNASDLLKRAENLNNPRLSFIINTVHGSRTQSKYLDNAEEIFDNLSESEKQDLEYWIPLFLLSESIRDGFISREVDPDRFYKLKDTLVDSRFPIYQIWYYRLIASVMVDKKSEQIAAEAIDKAISLLQSINPNHIDLISVYSRKGQIILQMKLFDEGLELMEFTFENYQIDKFDFIELKTPIDVLTTLLEKIHGREKALFILSNKAGKCPETVTHALEFKIAQITDTFCEKIRLLLECKETLLKKESIVAVRLVLWELTATYLNHGDFDKAIECNKELLESHEKFPSETIGPALGMLGHIYYTMGNYKLGSQYFAKAIILEKEYKRVTYKTNIAVFLAFESSVSDMYGKLDKSLEQLNEALSYYDGELSIRQKENQVAALIAKSLRLRKLGRIDEAIDLLKSLFQLIEEYDYANKLVDIVWVIYRLIQCYIDKKDIFSAKALLSDFPEFSEKDILLTVTIHLKLLANALILKNSTRITEKVKAQELLKQVVEDSSVEYHVYIDALLNYLELLFIELSIFGELEVLSEVEGLLAKLHSKAQEQKSSILLINSHLMRSKLYLIQGALTQAQEEIEHASRIAVDKEIHHLIPVVEKEEFELKSELFKWKKLLKSNAELSERIEQSHIKEYIKQAKTMLVTQ